MNINAFQKGDLKISPTAKYIVNGKELTSKEFTEYIGSEGGEDEEPEQTKKTDSKKRRSRADTVRDSEREAEQAASDVQ